MHHALALRARRLIGQAAAGISGDSLAGQHPRPLDWRVIYSAGRFRRLPLNQRQTLRAFDVRRLRLLPLDERHTLCRCAT
ncbi:hypothetical protein ASF59_09895 [Methylobacterium sp. Leaf121]|nr:hypothetical protein ASF59_09895 [Methylobacterium sp. Leaf121]